MNTTETPENKKLGSSAGLGPAVRAAHDDWYAAATFATMGNEWTWAAWQAATEAAALAVAAVPSHRWVDGSDQWGNPCPAKVVANRADYVAAIRGA